MSAATPRPPVPPAALVLGGIVSIQVGAALATGLIGLIGSSATVAYRLAVAAVVLLAIARPRLRGHARRDLLTVLAFGTSLAVMNWCFYAAIGRLPLGVATTVEFLGPLGLAAALARRPRDVAAVLAAVLGVVLVSEAPTVPWDRIDLVGIALALTAGAAWACYILLSRAVGRAFAELDGLALAMTVAALLVLPLGIAGAAGPVATPGVLATALAIGLLSSVVPYSLELVALRHLHPRTFGILLSLEPAVAAVAGLVVLGQVVSPVQVPGMALVVLASMLVVGGRRRTVAEEVAELG